MCCADQLNPPCKAVIRVMSDYGIESIPLAKQWTTEEFYFSSRFAGAAAAVSKLYGLANFLIHPIDVALIRSTSNIYSSGFVP